MEHESDNCTDCNLCSWYSHQRVDTRIGGLGSKGMGGDCQNYSIIEICQNTEKSPGDLRRLAHSNFSERPENKNRQKNNSMDGLSNKQATSPTSFSHQH